MRKFISGPAIAKLILKPRMTVNDHLRAGRYGRVHRIGRVVYVDLAEVEGAEGVEFSESQIEDAMAGKPGRLITIAQEPA